MSFLFQTSPCNFKRKGDLGFGSRHSMSSVSGQSEWCNENDIYVDCVMIHIVHNNQELLDAKVLETADKV